jgi:hypothetical protein
MQRYLRIAPGVIALAVAVNGCGSSSSNTSTPTGPTPTVMTETFNGSIGQGGMALHTFTVNNSGYALLAGFTSITPTSVTTLGLGIGSWDASTSTCSLNLTQNDTARIGSTAINGTAAAAAFCVRVYDGGNIGAPDVTASYTVQVQHY